MNNISAESVESVNINPYRVGWTEVERDSANGRSIVEYRQVGDDVLNPLVLRVMRVNRKVFHAAHGPDTAVDGTEFTIHLSTDISVEDSVAGRLPYIPLNIQFKLQFGGVYLPDSTDVLTLALTVASTLYGSVSTGTPATDNIAKLAAGGIDILS